MAIQMGSFDFTTLFFFVVAIIVFVQLRSVLGKRTGHEKPRNEQNYRDAYSEQDADTNVVTLPQRGTKSDEEIIYAAIDDYADKDTALNKGLRQIVDQDPQFTPKQFLDGAQMAYDMIVTAFAEGDRKSLKNLLSRDVYDSYVAAINERESRNETVKFNFVGVEKADIVQADVNGRDANVSVKLVSQIISATLDKDGEVIDGDLEEIAEAVDIWTFSRDLKARDPNWRLVASEPDG